VTHALIYHDVASVEDRDRCGFPGPGAARYKLTPEKFEAHLSAIEKAGVSVGLIGGGHRAALTFDDGGSSALTIARELEKHGWRGYFFVTTGRIDTPGFLSADQIRELAAAGHEVGSHSDSHPTYMGALSRPEIAHEWTHSRELLTNILGSPPATAAVPGGFVSGAVIEEAASAGYALLMTSKPTSRLISHGNLLVHGRYAVWATTSSARAAAYARGGRLARGGLWLAWCGKTAPKRLSPRAYEALRQAVIRRRKIG
jgi:peptidoglycan/xylan/chitin deacetylase (PgdA/CDA1 family)